MAKQRGFTVVATYKDEGISGNDRTRPGYQQLRAALDAGKIDVVLADETSRVSAIQRRRWHSRSMEFRRQYLVTRDGVDTRSESAKMVLSMKAVVDQMESRKIGTRVYGSLRKQFEMGFAVGGKPYGYRLIESGNYPRSFLQIAKQQARLFVRIFVSRSEGMSERAIASELNGGSAEPRSKSETHGAAHGRQVDALQRASQPPETSVSCHPSLGSFQWVKRPHSSLRAKRERDESEWITRVEPALRIVKEDLWKRVEREVKGTEERTAKQRGEGKNSGGRSRTQLMSGLLICDECEGKFNLVNKHRYGWVPQERR